MPEAQAAKRARLDWRTKGLPPAAEGLTGEEIGGLGLNLLAGDLMMPAAVIREQALRRNIAQMQAFADRQGARLCPHGKTTMSPELIAMQLAGGAWGMTAATAHHVRIYRHLGVSRILLANQLVGRSDMDYVLEEIARDPGFDFYCLADSVEGVELLADAARGAGCPRPVQLLIESGFPGGRAGVRGGEEGLRLARRIGELSPHLALRGFETFEGIRQAVPDARSEAGEMIANLVLLAEAAAGEGLLGEAPLLLSAGGSAFLDLCAAGLPREIGGRPVERIIRPGCYVTHDSGIYERLTRPGGTPLPGLPDLQPALEVWGVVQSVPEPGLAIVSVGKRDISHDVDPPIPLHVFRSSRDRRPRPAEGLSTAGLWDQHLSLAAPEGALAVGDLIGLGVSHPCSTFDRWSAILTVDEDYRVTGAVTTLF